MLLPPWHNVEKRAVAGAWPMATQAPLTKKLSVPSGDRGHYLQWIQSYGHKDACGRVLSTAVTVVDSSHPYRGRPGWISPSLQLNL
jgi:hypothetical protein